MFAPAGRLLRPLLFATTLLFGPVGAAFAADATAPAQTPPAGATISASPAVLTASVPPGSQGTATLSLRAGQSLDVTVDAQGLGQSPDDGSFSFLDASQDSGSHTARPYITLSPASFHMEAGSSQEIKVTFAVPAGAGDGERYAILRVTGQSSGSGGNVGFKTALGVSVILTLSASNQVRTAALENLSTATPAAGQPLVVSGDIRNTGNTHYGAPPSPVTETATLVDASGKTVATGKTTMTGNSLVPGLFRHFSVQLTTVQLAAGTYTVQVQAAFPDGTALAHGTTSLEVGSQAVQGAGTNGVSGSGSSSQSNLPVLLIGAGGALGGAVLVAIVLFVAGFGRRRRVAGQASDN